MIISAFFVIGTVSSRELHVLDLGLVFTKTTDEFLLVSENTHVVNFMQPIFLNCEMEDRNSHFYINVIDETRSMIQHSGMGPYVNNLTEETWTCEDVGFTGQCLDKSFETRPFYLGKIQLALVSCPIFKQIV